MNRAVYFVFVLSVNGGDEPEHLSCYVCVSCGFDTSDHNPVTEHLLHECGGDHGHERCYVSILINVISLGPMLSAFFIYMYHFICYHCIGWLLGQYDITKLVNVHSPEEVARGHRLLCWLIFFPFLSLTSLDGLVLQTFQA